MNVEGGVDEYDFLPAPAFLFVSLVALASLSDLFFTLSPFCRPPVAVNVFQ